MWAVKGRRSWDARVNAAMVMLCQPSKGKAGVEGGLARLVNVNSFDEFDLILVHI